ncbi:MAG: hypothetical protein JNJ89_04550 [Rubrivivax sp.]|nr:hypothetical protein [Rubrivivax sp.]
MKIPLPSNTVSVSDPQELVRHFSSTYFGLRIGLAILAFAFPFILFAYGKLRHGLDLQPSMSSYFWAAAGEVQCATFPMRTLFVGFLCAIAVGLHAYKGFTPLENTLLNAAALCAAAVAIFPESIDPREAKTDPHIATLFQTCRAVHTWAEQDGTQVHLVAAVALFVLLAIVSWSCAEKTLEFAPPTVDVESFRRTYKGLALAMLLFPLPGLAAAWLFGLWDTHKVFFIEAAGILIFGAYWALKSREMWLSQPEKEPQQAVDNARRRQQRRADAAAAKADDAAGPIDTHR